VRVAQLLQELIRFDPTNLTRQRGGVRRFHPGPARPQGIPVPLLQIGVTDARFLSRAGVQTYGLLPLRLPETFEFTKLIHAADERVPVEALEFGAEAVWPAIQRFR
jgi:hypothetical protein